MTGYTGKKYFKISEGDAGTEAYHDRYVQHLEAELNAQYRIQGELEKLVETTESERNELARMAYRLKELLKMPVASYERGYVSSLNPDARILFLSDEWYLLARKAVE